MPQTYAGQRITADLLASDYCAADTNTNVVTSATQANLSTIYTIPAGDPQASTAYRLSCSGNGTWGSTAQALTFQPALGGVNGVSLTIGSGQFNTSQNFRWSARLLIVCVATGSGGEFHLTIDVVASNYNTNLLFNNINNATIAGTASDSSGETVNTTASMNFEIDALWNSATGAPTITCHSTLFEKLGG